MLLLLCVNVTYVSVIECDFAASKCCHYCGINIASTVCSAPICCCHCVHMLHMCWSLYVTLLLVNITTAVVYMLLLLCAVLLPLYVTVIVFKCYIAMCLSSYVMLLLVNVATAVV